VWERGAAAGVLECVAQADPAHAGACACMWGVCVRSVVCVRTCMRTTHMRAHDAPNRSDGVQICLVCSWGGGGGQGALMLVRARPPHKVCACMFVCGGDELVALHAGQALLLLLLLLLPWLLPSSYACAARPSSVTSKVKDDGWASRAVAHMRRNLQGVGVLGLRGGAGRGGRRQRGWRAVRDTTEAQKEVVGGLNEEMPDMMIRGPYAQIDFIYERDKWEQNRDAYAGKRRRPERSGLDNDFEPTRGRALFEDEIWDQNSLGPVKYKLYMRAVSGEEVERCRDILPGTRAYAMCVRLWSACRFGLEEEIVPALINGASVHMWDLECQRFDREEGDTPYDKSGLEGCNALHWAAFGDEPLCIDTLTQVCSQCVPNVFLMWS